MVKIYARICPVTQEIRYIGKTARKLQSRLNAHVTESRRFRQSHKHRWIANCVDAGLRPKIWLLEEVPAGERWQDRERAWISRALELGFALTNRTEGGEGMVFLDAEEYEKYCAAVSKASKKRYEENASIVLAMIEGNKRSWAENREERISAIQAGWSDESRAKHREIMASI